jgi:hypothetical protein
MEMLVTIAHKTAITEASNHVSLAGGVIFFSGSIVCKTSADKNREAAS